MPKKDDEILVPKQLSPEQMNAVFGDPEGKDGQFNQEILSQPFVRDGDSVDSSQPLGDQLTESAITSDGIAEGATNVIGTNPDTRNPIVRPKRPEEPFIKMPLRTDKPGARPGTVDELLAQIAKTSDFQPFDLPSRGLMDPKEPRLSSGSILVRPMRAAEEEILATGRLFRNGDGLEMIFKRCIMFGDKSPLDDPLQLLSLDRIAVLIAIRIMTYGSLYDFSIVCGNCRKSFESEVDLDVDLDVHYLHPDQSIGEPLRSVFPECGLEFTYRLSRGYDEQASMQYARERERRFAGKATDDSFIERAKRLVVSVGGFSERETIDKALGLIKGSDLHHLRQAIDNPAFGVDTRIVLDCPFCLSENRLRLPMGADFFIPRLQETTESSPE